MSMATSRLSIELAQAREGIVPVRIDGDSREVLNKQMRGEVWLSREQIYAAKALLPIEYPPAVTHDGRSVEEIKAEGVREYLAAQPDSSEALLQAILRLKDVDEEEMKPPPQIIRPPLPKPTVRRKPSAPVIDHEADAASVELSAKSGVNAGVGVAKAQATHTHTHHSAPASEHSGGNSEPDEVVEITAEECAVVAATPIHLRTGRWRRN